MLCKLFFFSYSRLAYFLYARLKFIRFMFQSEVKTHQDQQQQQKQQRQNWRIIWAHNFIWNIFLDGLSFSLRIYNFNFIYICVCVYLFWHMPAKNLSVVGVNVSVLHHCTCMVQGTCMHACMCLSLCAYIYKLQIIVHNSLVSCLHVCAIIFLSQDPLLWFTAFIASVTRSIEQTTKFDTYLFHFYSLYSSLLLPVSLTPAHSWSLFFSFNVNVTFDPHDSRFTCYHLKTNFVSFFILQISFKRRNRSALCYNKLCELCHTFAQSRIRIWIWCCCCCCVCCLFFWLKQFCMRNHACMFSSLSVSNAFRVHIVFLLSSPSSSGTIYSQKREENPKHHQTSHRMYFNNNNNTKKMIVFRTGCNFSFESAFDFFFFSFCCRVYVSVLRFLLFGYQNSVHIHLSYIQTRTSIGPTHLKHNETKIEFHASTMHSSHHTHNTYMYLYEKFRLEIRIKNGI